MQARQLITIPAKIALLTLALFAIFIVSSMVTGMARVSPPSTATEPPPATGESPRDLQSASNSESDKARATSAESDTRNATASVPAGQTKAALGLLAACFLQSSVLAYVIKRSRWHGLRLAFTIFAVLFGLTAIMTHVETLVFMRSVIAEGVLPRLIGMSFVTAALFAPLAVLVLGKFRSTPTQPQPAPHPAVRMKGLINCLLAAIGVYVVLYFTFGYFIVWQDAAARAFYGGDPNADVASAASLSGLVRMFTGQPRLVLLQSARALMWVAIAWPVVRMMTGGAAQAALAVALLFGVLFPSQLLVPNPWMPDHLRWLHLLETSTSTFLFGLFVGWTLHRLSAPKTAASP
ncbi:MAG: hypothetical protein V3T70_05025 [Phycisphaerae bacterium]